MTDQGKQHLEEGMNIRRIESLTDGIFAIAMTLLVLAIDFPHEGPGVQSKPLSLLLFGQGQEFYNYALSFILLANFWILHHQIFHFFRQTNPIHLWINIIQLMFIALVPFSSSAAGDFPDQRLAQFLFGGNMFLIGLLFLVNWAYATWGHRLIDGRLAFDRIRGISKKLAVIPAVALLAVAVAFFSPTAASYVYILIPVILFYARIKTIGNR